MCTRFWHKSRFSLTKVDALLPNTHITTKQMQEWKILGNYTAIYCSSDILPAGSMSPDANYSNLKFTAY